jgi:hypothetical protein
MSHPINSPNKLPKIEEMMNIPAPSSMKKKASQKIIPFLSTHSV